MTPPTTPRLTLTHAMFLIAATAVGLAVVKANQRGLYEFSPVYLITESNVDDIRDFVQWHGDGLFWRLAVSDTGRWMAKASPVAAAWTVALIVIRMMPPRPSRSRLFRQPGFVACLAVLGTLLLNLPFVGLQLVLAALNLSSKNDPRFYANVAFVAQEILRPDLIGASVVAAWAILGLSGRWRSEPTWLDRAGVGSGILWVILLGIEWIRTRFI